MKYSIWNLYLFLLLFLSIIGVLLVAGWSFGFYKSTVNSEIEHLKKDFKVLLNTPKSAVLPNQEVVMIYGNIENAMHILSELEDVEFLRMVDTETKTVTESHDEKELGMKIESLPLFEKEIITRNGLFRGELIKEFSAKSGQGDNFWMGVSLKGIKKNALLTAVLLSAGLLFVFAIIGSVIFYISNKFIIYPLIELVGAFQRLKEGEYGTRLGEASSMEMQNVFQHFNDMVDKLIKIKEQEIKLNERKSEFISVAAHQLRTPMSAVKWAIKMVLDGDAGHVNSEQKEILNHGYKSNDRMILLVNDLLSASQIDVGKFEYIFEELLLDKMLEEMVKNFRQQAKQTGVDINYSNLQTEPVKIKADPEKLKTAVENIIDNAVKYTNSGGKVDVSLRLEDKTAEVVVADTGVGIPKNQLENVFMKFFRARNVVKMQTDGSGLGLFIAKQIIEKHGGKIWIDSSEGKGTTVHFTLPVIESEPVLYTMKKKKS